MSHKEGSRAFAPTIISRTILSEGSHTPTRNDGDARNNKLSATAPVGGAKEKNKHVITAHTPKPPSGVCVPMGSFSPGLRTVPHRRNQGAGLDLASIGRKGGHSNALSTFVQSGVTSGCGEGGTTIPEIETEDIPKYCTKEEHAAEVNKIALALAEVFSKRLAANREQLVDKVISKVGDLARFVPPSGPSTGDGSNTPTTSNHLSGVADTASASASTSLATATAAAQPPHSLTVGAAMTAAVAMSKFKSVLSGGLDANLSIEAQVEAARKAELLMNRSVDISGGRHGSNTSPSNSALVADKNAKGVREVAVATAAARQAALLLGEAEAGHLLEEILMNRSASLFESAGATSATLKHMLMISCEAAAIGALHPQDVVNKRIMGTNAPLVSLVGPEHLGSTTIFMASTPKAPGGISPKVVPITDSDAPVFWSPRDALTQHAAVATLNPQLPLSASANNVQRGSLLLAPGQAKLAPAAALLRAALRDSTLLAGGNNNSNRSLDVLSLHDIIINRETERSKDATTNPNDASAEYPRNKSPLMRPNTRGDPVDFMSAFDGQPTVLREQAGPLLHTERLTAMTLKYHDEEARPHKAVAKWDSLGKTEATVANGKSGSQIGSPTKAASSTQGKPLAYSAFAEFSEGAHADKLQSRLGSKVQPEEPSGATTLDWSTNDVANKVTEVMSKEASPVSDHGSSDFPLPTHQQPGKRSKRNTVSDNYGRTVSIGPTHPFLKAGDGRRATGASTISSFASTVHPDELPILAHPDAIHKLMVMQALRESIQQSNPDAAALLEKHVPAVNFADLGLNSNGTAMGRQAKDALLATVATSTSPKRKVRKGVIVEVDPSGLVSVASETIAEGRGSQSLNLGNETQSASGGSDVLGSSDRRAKLSTYETVEDVLQATQNSLFTVGSKETLQQVRSEIEVTKHAQNKKTRQLQIKLRQTVQHIKTAYASVMAQKKTASNTYTTIIGQCGTIDQHIKEVAEENARLLQISQNGFAALNALANPPQPEAKMFVPGSQQSTRQKQRDAVKHVSDTMIAEQSMTDGSSSEGDSSSDSTHNNGPFDDNEGDGDEGGQGQARRHRRRKGGNHRASHGHSNVTRAFRLSAAANTEAHNNSNLDTSNDNPVLRGSNNASAFPHGNNPIELLAHANGMNSSELNMEPQVLRGPGSISVSVASAGAASTMVPPTNAQISLIDGVYVGQGNLTPPTTSIHSVSPSKEIGYSSGFTAAGPTVSNTNSLAVPEKPGRFLAPTPPPPSDSAPHQTARATGTELTIHLAGTEVGSDDRRTSHSSDHNGPWSRTSHEDLKGHFRSGDTPGPGTFMYSPPPLRSVATAAVTRPNATTLLTPVMAALVPSSVGMMNTTSAANSSSPTAQLSAEAKESITALAFLLKSELHSLSTQSADRMMLIEYAARKQSMSALRLNSPTGGGDALPANPTEDILARATTTMKRDYKTDIAEVYKEQVKKSGENAGDQGGKTVGSSRRIVSKPTSPNPVNGEAANSSSGSLTKRLSGSRRLEASGRGSLSSMLELSESGRGGPNPYDADTLDVESVSERGGDSSSAGGYGSDGYGGKKTSRRISRGVKATAGTTGLPFSGSNSSSQRPSPNASPVASPPTSISPIKRRHAAVNQIAKRGLPKEVLEDGSTSRPGSQKGLNATPTKGSTGSPRGGSSRALKSNDNVLKVEEDSAYFSRPSILEKGAVEAAAASASASQCEGENKPSRKGKNKVANDTHPSSQQPHSPPLQQPTSPAVKSALKHAGGDTKGASTPPKLSPVHPVNSSKAAHSKLSLSSGPSFDGSKTSASATPAKQETLAAVKESASGTLTFALATAASSRRRDTTATNSNVVKFSTTENDSNNPNASHTSVVQALKGRSASIVSAESKVTSFGGGGAFSRYTTPGWGAAAFGNGSFTRQSANGNSSGSDGANNRPRTGSEDSNSKSIGGVGGAMSMFSAATSYATTLMINDLTIGGRSAADYIADIDDRATGHDKKGRARHKRHGPQQSALLTTPYSVPRRTMDMANMKQVSEILQNESELLQKELDGEQARHDRIEERKRRALATNDIDEQLRLALSDEESEDGSIFNTNHRRSTESEFNSGVGIYAVARERARSKLSLTDVDRYRVRQLLSRSDNLTSELSKLQELLEQTIKDKNNVREELQVQIEGEITDCETVMVRTNAEIRKAKMERKDLVTRYWEWRRMCEIGDWRAATTFYKDLQQGPKRKEIAIQCDIQTETLPMHLRRFVKLMKKEGDLSSRLVWLELKVDELDSITQRIGMELQCPICQKHFREPVLMRPCGHGYCQRCFEHSPALRLFPDDPSVLQCVACGVVTTEAASLSDHLVAEVQAKWAVNTTSYTDVKVCLSALKIAITKIQQRSIKKSMSTMSAAILVQHMTDEGIKNDDSPLGGGTGGYRRPQ